ncbi:dihydroorotase, partial [Singulisphaera rosea]
GCAGAYCAPASLPTYAEVFAAAGVLERLEGFASRFGAEFYGLPLNQGQVSLIETTPGDEVVPVLIVADNTQGERIRPWRAGERLGWRVAP